ncbi:MAG: Serine/threonine-protein kinase RsbT [candidate division WS2 bacterium]|nr:Serine/threonine-protein kinase RsbT [Candidatus Lithacetigena glycinireducens]MBT9174698.1 Serine/threonine-protein kinase RsbT [Candidatus Lithacetigena glycinireducens]
MDLEATNKLEQETLSCSVEKVMVRNIPQVTPYWQMRHVKELMRIRRLDGVPITDDEGHLLGIISISDLIICIENKDLEAPVSKYMTTPVKYLILNKTLIEALREMNRFKFGRLPVVDDKFKVIGVVYWWSLFAFLQEALDTGMVVKKTTPSEGVISYTYQILGKDFVHAGNASLQMRKSLQQLSIDPKDLRRIGIIAYEAEMNIIIYADRGSLQAKVNSEKVEVIAEDKGPGIPDVNLALQEGFTTAPDYIREMGFGAGMGLPNIKRNADIFQVDSRVGVGTKVYAVVNLTRR